MNFLFVHQNYQAQYRELIHWLVAQGGHKIVFLHQREDVQEVRGVDPVYYAPAHKPADTAFDLSRETEMGMGNAYGAWKAARKLREDGFTPDIIIGHGGWGELLFLKDIWPQTPMIGFFELFYSINNSAIGFDPIMPRNTYTRIGLQARNTLNEMTLHEVDMLQCPTQWQADTYPARYHERMYVEHDGIRTDHLRPDPGASIKLGRLTEELAPGAEVLSFMARNLEPVRGFHVFMRALPRIMAARPKARVIIIGGSGVSYGSKLNQEGGWRKKLTEEVSSQLDMERVHFVGRVPYSVYRQVIQVTRCHVYFTMPFVLSWSFMEAMSMGATLVASDTAPLREVAGPEHVRLSPFHDADALAQRVIEVLEAPGDFAHLGLAARAHIVERYDFMTKCLPVHLQKINDLVPMAKRIALPG